MMNNIVNMKQISLLMCTGILSIILNACMSNDIPYPVIEANFETFEVEGQLAAPVINTKDRTVSIQLNDAVDPAHVKLISYTTTPDAVVTPALGEYLDLSRPMQVTLSIYQDYVWTIKAEQKIDRKFVVEGQIGQAVFNVDELTAIAYVPTTTPTNNIKIKELQLGPTGSTLSPDPATVTNFTTPQTFTVTYRNVTEKWKVLVLQKSDLVETLDADAFVKIAYLHGIGQVDAENGFDYKKATDAGWTTVDPQQVISDNGVFTARIKNLEPETQYVCRAYSGTQYGDEKVFTTEKVLKLRNPSFDYWSTTGSEPKLIYNPWDDTEEQFWDTGNRGATTVGASNTVPAAPAPGLSGKSAMLQSKYIIIKFAAGNIFIGNYVRTDGSDGVLNFGKPYTSRPIGVKGKYNYSPGNIQYYSKSNPDLSRMEGKPDTCTIYMALTDGNAPVEIRTNKNNRKLFDKDADEVFAYGQLNNGSTTNGWVDFTIMMDFKETNRKATYIVLVASSSKYGDYFTGSKESILYLDDLELIYE